MLYGYTIHIWNSIKHNGKFSHVTRRSVTIRLSARMNDEQVILRSAIALDKPKEIIMDGLTIKTSGEYVYGVSYLGIATSRTVWDYKK